LAGKNEKGRSPEKTIESSKGGSDQRTHVRNRPSKREKKLGVQKETTPGSVTIRYRNYWGLVGEILVRGFKVGAEIRNIKKKKRNANTRPELRRRKKADHLRTACGGSALSRTSRGGGIRLI